MFLISGCLLGKDCKYDGGNNSTSWVREFAKEHDYILICPETAGGLTAPRPPAERIAGKVIDKEGKDLTRNFEEGASRELARAKEICQDHREKIDGAILKANSPSCGKDTIYDGTFTGTLTKGHGCFTQLLINEGIPVFTEKDETKVKENY